MAAVNALTRSELFVTAVTVGEIRSGIALLPEGRRKLDLFKATEGILADDFEGRILPFDTNASAYYADLTADRVRAGRLISTADGQIAAICRQHGATLATRNVRDFELMGIDLIDPWSA